MLDGPVLLSLLAHLALPIGQSIVCCVIGTPRVAVRYWTNKSNNVREL